MNILIINYEYPPLGGGAGKQSGILAEEFSKRHKVIVLTSSFKGLARKEKKNENLCILRIPTLRQKRYRTSPIEFASFLLAGYFYACNICRHQKVDITISFFTTPCGYISAGLKKSFKVPYIISLRGFDVPGFLPKDLGLLQNLNLPFIKSAWNYADGIVANSNFLADLVGGSQQHG